MADQTITPLVERLRAQAARHREHATGIASAALLEEAVDQIGCGLDALAVDYVLKCIQGDPGIAYLMGYGTESFSRLTAARAARRGLDLETYRRELWDACAPVRVRYVDEEE